MIELKNVSKIYKSKKTVETEALKNINLKLEGVGMVFLLGKSGSGKSTLLNLLGALDEPTSGTIRINELDLTKEIEYSLDSYRNSSIGFVFQDFNLLENFNVYENIELALKLQEKRISQEKLDQTLRAFGLEGLGLRKINELSGGQKQRVAMVRAMIKNPSILLADEPTGNLDAASSKLVFDLLKEISKEKLVIIVSHDIEASRIYADRIIELKDGKIESDTGALKEKKQSSKRVSPYLPIGYALKTAGKNLFIKPFKLILTVVLLSISLILMTFTLNCNLFSKTLLVEDTMKANDDFKFSLSHITWTLNTYGGFMANYQITDSQFSYFDSLSQSILNPSYTLYDHGTYLSFSYPEREEEDIFFPQVPFIANYVELKDDRYLKEVEGSLPTKKGEMVVHEYLAKYMMKFGVEDTEGKMYKPSSIEALIKEKHPLKLGGNEVTITGVVKEDTSLYQESFQKNKFQSKELEEFYQKDYVGKSHTVYVKDFVETSRLSNPKDQVLEKTYLQINHNFEQNLAVLKEEKTIYTKEGRTSISALEQDEVILSLDTLSKIDEEFQASYSNFLKSHRVEDIEFDSFLEEYIRNNSLEKISPVLRTLKNNNEWVVYFPKVVGLTSDPKNYISSSIMESYEPFTKELTSIKVYEPNHLERNKILSKVKVKELTSYDEDFELEYDLLQTDYQEGTTEVMSYYKFLKKYILILTCVFLFFTILLFLNFLYTTITYSKKEIGILRSLGASKKDVTKIFLLEAILIGVVSYVVSMMGFVGIMNYMNYHFTSKYFYTLHVILFHPLLTITMLLFTLLLVFLIPILAIDRIHKIKPMDAILEK